jgi:chromosomal replication initiator protein
METIWNEFLKIVYREAGSQVVETWFKAVKFVSWEKNITTATLQMPNQFVIRWVKDHYLHLLRTHLGHLLDEPQITFAFITPVASSTTSTIIPSTVLKKVTPPKEGALRDKHYTDLIKSKKRSTKLNEKYTFDSFIVGPSNSLAHAAAVAIANNLGKDYNPLLIYGGTGLGKTHLLHCIGNEVMRKNPDAKVRYETSDNFMTEFINAIKSKRSQTFRQKYEKMDILLLDDIQFFSNKEQTQEMFFHIFNALYENGKHIMSSDLLPQNINGLQDRLKSRLNWGLVVDIQAPQLETKIAILERKADSLKIKIDPEATYFIASSIISNVRELEGALTRISAYSSLTDQVINLAMATHVLQNIQQTNKECVLLYDVLKVVCKYYAVPIADIKSQKRHKNIATVRQIAFYVMKKLTYSPLQAIGEYLGNRNHSTVIHAITKVGKMIHTDIQLSEKIRSIEHEIMTRSS